METIKVFSKNADYQRFEVIKSNRNKRYRYGIFFAEGVRNINEALKNHWSIVSWLYCPDSSLSGWAQDLIRRIPTEVNYHLTASLMQELSGKSDTSELMALIRMRPDDAVELPQPSVPLYALFDRPSNKGNLGTIIRSCDALGVDALVLTGHGVDPYDPDTITSTMGSFFKVPVIRMADNASVEGWIADLRQRYPTLKVIGTTAHHEKVLFETDLTGPVLFMIGNETDGLCMRFKEICDVMTTIPMAEDSAATSFNVACASTVLFYEAVRQRMLR